MYCRAVEQAGPEGISQQQLAQALGHGKLESRTICRQADFIIFNPLS
jgi:hypothetical protein